MDQSHTSLPEDLLLLCSVEGHARVQLPPYSGHALAGAGIADLLLSGLAVLEGDRVRLRTTAPCGHPPTDLTVLALAERVGTRYGTPLEVCLDRLRDRTLQSTVDSLVRRGLLQEREEKRFLRRDIGHYVTDRRLLDLCTAELPRAVADPDAPARTRVLAALAHAAGLTLRYYHQGHPAKLRDYAVNRLAQLVAADPVALAVDGRVRREAAREQGRRDAASAAAAAASAAAAVAQS